MSSRLALLLTVSVAAAFCLPCASASNLLTCPATTFVQASNFSFRNAGIGTANCTVHFAGGGGATLSGGLIGQASLGSSQTLTYDSLGHIMAFQTGSGRTITVSSLGSVVSAMDPAGHVTNFTYTFDGHVSSVTDPFGGLTSYVYGGTDLASATSSAGGTTSFAYDFLGEMTSTADPGGIPTSFVYSDGILAKEILWGGDTYSFNHDAAGQIVSMSNPQGHVTSFVYNGDGNLVQEIAWGGSVVASYAYDSLGEMTSMTDAQGHVTYFVYGNGHLLEDVAWGGATTFYNYNFNGLLTSIIGPDGRPIQLGWDEQQRLVWVNDIEGLTRFSYDAPFQPPAVPEPASLTLLGTGLLGLARAARRKH